MAKIMDRLLLFIYSISIGVISVIAILLLSGAVPYEVTPVQEQRLFLTGIIIAGILLLMSIRFFYISVRRDRSNLNSIDQRTDFGEIQISVETIENLCLKAASRVRGVKDLKSRIKVSQAGLDIAIRAVVDGEESIPQLTTEVQKQVHDFVEDTTGIPVASVSVYIANVVQAPSFKSRVE
ncbi:MULTISPECIES: alkaline shock response membrane anchor protein AmaP [Paenibacillus]|uniref:Alkaline shock response membrane anchor protein AmaP n=1 Tax=Paenibacillus campinasensis TaxID=66347 RepID=A0A268F3B9_9BACL|nr:alkaline shock response membrane anchor protein AmaP [Paenibacillus campinasensis]MUG64903.1 alkaline shock response membrane anchor protein AmaP [Paenibacillus campinasensis]PAD79875.1 alkaline shock response membrane anchor protein AmaP [Paenibacillus campinasensis]